MRFFVFLLLMTSMSIASAMQVATVNAQQVPLAQQVSLLLSQAKSAKEGDLQKRIALANEALQLSQQSHQALTSAQAHYLLGKLTSEANENKKSLHHFLQASTLYQKIGDNQNYITSSVDYIYALVEEKAFVQANKKLDALLPLAFQHGESFLIAITLKLKGDNYYQQMQFDLAVVQYLMAIEYLQADEKKAQKLAGKTYTKIAQAYKRIEDKEKTAEYYEKALTVFTKIGETRYMARTLNTLSEAQRQLGNLLVALDYALKSLTLHEQVDDPEGQAKAQLGAGTIYRFIGRYEQSLEHVHKAQKYFKSVNDVTGIAKTSNQIGHIYFRLEQFDQARSFYMIAISLPELEMDPNTLATALRESAIIDWKKGNFASALKMAQKADRIYQDIGDKEKQSITLRIVANIYRDQNNLTNATAYYKRSLALATEISSDLYQIKTLIPFAAMLINRDVEEAITLLKKSLALASKKSYHTYMLDSYRYLRLAEKSRGNLAASLQYAENEIAISEIIKVDVNNDALALEKAKLHSLRLEIELDTLREKNKLDKLELAKKNNEIEIARQATTISELELIKNKYASIALALLLAVCVIVMLLIYRRFILSKKQNQELDYLATRDPLTNCFNRRVLFDLMNRDFAQSPRPKDYCIIMIDVDHFKSINDNYGHTIGDSVLCSIASTIQGCTRQQDITARFGGEEFCIVLPDTPTHRALEIAEKIRETIQASQFNDIALTCSFGVTSIQFNAKTPSELIDQADLALFESKSQGRNQVTLWCASLAWEK